MSSSSSEEIFELNFIKIDKNEIRLVGSEDIANEAGECIASVAGFEEEKLGKNILLYLRKIFPDSPDLIKTQIEYSKQFLKLINSDKKKNFYSAINHILSIDYNENFIFNKTFEKCN